MAHPESAPLDASVLAAMRLALGLSVHTGWAAAVVAGGGWTKPVVALRERLEMLGANQRFVFHKAAEMKPDEARSWVAQAKIAATERARVVMRQLAANHSVNACAIVAKTGVMLPLEEVVAAHPRIH